MIRASIDGFDSRFRNRLASQSRFDGIERISIHRFDARHLRQTFLRFLQIVLNFFLFFQIIVVFGFVRFRDFGGVGVAIFLFQPTINPRQFEGFVVNTATVFAAQKVPTMHIVHVAIAVVVLAVAGYFAGICPHYGFQIFMFGINSTVNNRHDDRRTCLAFQKV